MNGILKILWHTGAAVFWLGAVVFTGLFSIGAFMSTACSWDEVEELYSPTGEYRAFVLMAGCGGFSRPRTQIYVERVKDRSLSPFIKDKTGQLILLDGKPDQVEYRISWRSNNEFVISDFNFEKMVNFENKSWGPNLPRVYFEIAGS